MLITDSEAIDFMTLLIQAQYGFLVNIIRCNDRQFGKPRQLITLGHFDEIIASHT